MQNLSIRRAGNEVSSEECSESLVILNGPGLNLQAEKEAGAVYSLTKHVNI